MLNYKGKLTTFIEIYEVARLRSLIIFPLDGNKLELHCTFSCEIAPRFIALLI